MKQIQDVGKLSIYDIFRNWKQLFNCKKDKIKYELKPTMTNLYKCRKCGSKEHLTKFKQDLDEPMTQFITCIHCNNRWRINCLDLNLDHLYLQHLFDNHLLSIIVLIYLEDKLITSITTI